MAGERLSILVVDDEEIVGKRLRQVLEKAGYEVEVFTSGREAVERLSEREFDIVVSDIRMDDVDGMDVLDAVRRTSERTKVILITGYATLELAREAAAKGACEFIAKPFYPKDLLAAIEKASADMRRC